LKLLGFTAQPLTPLNRPGKENQKFKFFSKCSENSKNFKEYYSKVTDHEYLVSSAILYRYCGEIAGWAVERGERLSSEPEYYTRQALPSFNNTDKTKQGILRPDFVVWSAWWRTLYACRICSGYVFFSLLCGGMEGMLCVKKELRLAELAEQASSFWRRQRQT
jgi:hypothetical protein